MKNIIKLLTISIIAGLAGCSNQNFEDIDQWMKVQESSLKGRIPQLPPAKSFEPKDFIAKEDPFVVKAPVSLLEFEKNQFAPDQNRKKEPLENYSLDSIKMTGFMTREGVNYGLIKTADTLIHYVKIGNYMGKNFGKVIKLDETMLVLDERFLDNTNTWVKKETKILLEENTKN